MTRHDSRWKYILFGAILGAATLCWWSLAERIDRDMREDVLAQARLISGALNIDRIKALSGSEADLDRPEYRRLRDQLAATRAANPQCRFIYLMGRKENGAVFFYVDVQDDAAEQTPPCQPGELYDDASPGLQHSFVSGQALVEGPIRDTWGEWVSALIPLQDPKSGQTLAVLGVDIDARDWKQAVIAHAGPPVALTALALLGITACGSVLLSRRARMDSVPRWARYLEVLLTVAVGLVLASFAAWLAQTESTRNQIRAFRHLAELRTAALADSMQDLRDMELEGLARFHQGSEQVSAEEFRQYASHLARNQLVQAWEWVAAVASSDKEDFEHRAREQGLDNFRIWSKDAAGQPTPSSGRDMYFPVFRVIPEYGNSVALGYDLGSEPLRRAAIEEALRSGLATATEPVALVQETGSQQAMLVMRPVFAARGNPFGLALAVLRLENVLTVAGRDPMMDTTLFLARPTSAPEPVAVSKTADTRTRPAIALHRPLFCFGKTFIVSAYATPAFLDMHPARGGLAVGLSGLALTLGFAAVVSTLQRRRQSLEDLVRERTSALRASEAHLAATLRSMGDGVIACDRHGQVDSLNHVAEFLTGWTSDESAGLPLEEVYHIIHAQTRTAAESPVQGILRGALPAEPTNHIALVARNGEERQIAQSCTPIRDDSGEVTGAVLIFRDVSEEYQQRHALQESEAFQADLLKSLPVGVVIVDPTTRRIERVNEHAAALFGAPMDHLLGQRCHAVLCPADEGACPVCDLGQTIDHSDRLMLRADGGTLPILKTVKRVFLGGREKLLECFLDITKRKQAEDALRLERDLFTAGPVFTVEWAPSDGWPVRFVSENVRTILGYAPAEMMSTEFVYAALIHPDDAERIAGEVADNIARHIDHYEQSYRLRTKAGEYRWFYDFTMLVRDSRNELTGIRGYLYDQTMQKEAELALVTERTRLASILEGTHVGTWEWNVQTGEVEFNERWAEMIGYTLTELAPVSIETWTRHAHPDDLRLSGELLDKHFAGELGYYECEARMRHKDGQWVWVQDRGKVATWTEDGRPLVMMGTHQDITKRKRAEALLLHQKAHFESLFTNTSDAMVFFDPEHRITHVNTVFTDIFGYSRDEVLGRDINSVVDPQRQANEYGSPRILRGEQIEMETVRYTKSGQPKNVLIKGGPVRKEGEIVGGFAVYVDITQRKQAEEKLRFLGAITENMSDSMVTTDTNFSITYINKAAESLYGYTLDDLLGKKPDVFNAEALAEVIQNDIYAALISGRAYQGESLNRRKDGSTFVCEYKVFPLIDAQEQIHAYVGIQRNITERKQAEAKLHQFATQMELKNMELDAALARAEAATLAKSEFLANMSHEIRTPMNGIIGMTGLLLDMDLNETQRRYAEIVRSSGEALLGLVNDILDFSKIESGKLELEALEFDLRPMLDNFAAMMALKAEEKGLEFICAADPDVPDRLTGDPGRLRQILTNLAGNAVKFTTHGEVVITVSMVRDVTGLASVQPDTSGRSGLTITLGEQSSTDNEPPATVAAGQHSVTPAQSSRPAPGQRFVELCFSVRDTGIGIPADKVGNLFRSFSQVDASISRKFGGTGLGLAISKQLADMMNGSIGVTSADGRGSTFWFTVRLGVAEAETTSSPYSDLLRGVRALVVDDNTAQREFLLARFLDWGMRPDEAPDGPTALSLLHGAQAAGDPYRLAILDIQMPGMSGDILGRLIQAEPALHPVRTIALTAMARRDDLHQLQQAGFSARLTKPILHGELLDCLTMVMAKDDHSPKLIDRRASADTLSRFANRRARILLAEDNITNQQVAMGILKKLGLSADAVANGREAIEALKTLPYDLVLMDVQMPEMDGLEATRLIRSPGSGMANRDLPIIAMTAHAMQEDKDKCLHAGMNDFVSKPVSPHALAEALDKWLPTGRQQDGSPDRTFRTVQALPQISPVIFDRAAMLDRLLGDEDLAQEIISDFLLDIPRQFSALRLFLEKADVAGVLLQLHTIKGVAANMGADALRAVAADLENTARDGNLDGMTARLGELEAAFTTLRQTMLHDQF